MEMSWEAIAAAIGGVVAPGAAWVGTIQQRVANSEKKHEEHDAKFRAMSKRIDEHLKVSNDTNVAVGEINGKLDMLIRQNGATKH